MLDRKIVLYTIAIGLVIIIIPLCVFLAFNTTENDFIDPTPVSVLEPKTTTATELRQNIHVFVNTSTQLQDALANSLDRTVIHLADGIYIGSFNLSEDHIVLLGTGEGTILQPEEKATTVLTLSGDNCTIKSLSIISSNNITDIGLHLIGNNNSIMDVKFEGFKTAVSGEGDENKYSRVSVTSCKLGIYLNGNGNSLTDIQMSNLLHWGAHFNGHKNSAYSIICTNCSTGFFVQGDENSIKHLQVTPSSRWANYGIIISQGKGNIVEFYRSGKGELIVSHLARYSEVKNCEFSKVEIEGTGQYLVRVDAGTLMQVSGTGHRIERSKGEKLVNQGANVILVENEFKEIE